MCLKVRQKNLGENNIFQLTSLDRDRSFVPIRNQSHVRTLINLSVHRWPGVVYFENERSTYVVVIVFLSVLQPISQAGNGLVCNWFYWFGLHPVGLRSVGNGLALENSLVWR